MADTYLIQCSNCGTETTVAHGDTDRRQTCSRCGAPLIASHTQPQDVTDRTWDREVLQSTVPAIVIVWGEDCAACAAYEPSVRRMAGSLFGEARVLRLDIDQNPETPARYNVRGVPSVLLFDEGQHLHTLSGPQGEQGLRRMLDLE